MKSHLLSERELLEFRKLDEEQSEYVIYNIQKKNNEAIRILSEEEYINSLRSLVTEENTNHQYEFHFYKLYKTIDESVLANNHILRNLLKSEFGFREEQSQWFVNIDDIIQLIKSANQTNQFHFPITIIITLAKFHLQSCLLASMQELYYPRQTFDGRPTTKIGKEIKRLKKNFRVTPNRKYKKVNDIDENNLNTIIENDNIFKKHTQSLTNDFVDGKTKKLLKEVFKEIPYTNKTNSPSQITVNGHKFNLLKLLLPNDVTFLSEDEYVRSISYSTSTSYEAYKSKKVNSFLK
jgi:hypothetical protein